MTSLDVLAAEVAVSLPDVADPIVKAMLVRATMKVVDKAKLIKHTVIHDFYSGVTDYPVELPDCLTALRIDSVKLDGREVDFTQNEKQWISINSQLCNIKNIPDGVEIIVFSGISRHTCEIPTVIYERYGDVIRYRTISELYGMHGQEWYNASLVKFYGGLAEGGITEAKQDFLEQEIPDGIELDRGGFIL